MSSVSAYVTMELKVSVHVGRWDAAATFESLAKQAEREARASLAKICQHTNVRVLNEPGVMAVTIKE